MSAVEQATLGVSDVPDESSDRGGGRHVRGHRGAQGRPARVPERAGRVRPGAAPWRRGPGRRSEGGGDERAREAPGSGQSADGRLRASSRHVRAGRDRRDGGGRFTLPGLIALMAVGPSDRPRQSLVAEAITPATIERALDEIGRLRGVPIRASEVREVVELLTTGEVIVDVATGLRAALLLVPRLPVALTRDALALPELPREVVDAIQADLRDNAPRTPRDVDRGPPRRPAGRAPAHSHQHAAGAAGPGGSRRARRDDPGAHRAREPDAAARRARLRADPGHRPRREGSRRALPCARSGESRPRGLPGPRSRAGDVGVRRISPGRWRSSVGSRRPRRARCPPDGRGHEQGDLHGRPRVCAGFGPSCHCARSFCSSADAGRTARVRVRSSTRPAARDGRPRPFRPPPRTTSTTWTAAAA